MSNSVWCCFILVVACLLSACVDNPIRPQLPPPASRDEAAAVLVSVTAVAPWFQVADAVQPNFTLTGDGALLQVAPTTARIQEQVLNAFGASLGVGLPQSFGQSTATSTQSSSQNASTTGGVTTNTGNVSTGASGSSTETRQPGSAPQVPSGLPAGTHALGAPSVNGTTDIDPILKYQAALALYQSVQLMNRQVQNAASLHCFAPYLVQLKMAILPYRRDLPYDVHSRISFFGGGNSDEAGSPEFPLKIVGADESNEAGSLDYALKMRKFESLAQGQQPVPAAPPPKVKEQCDNKTKLPQIVPLLVTDDIERAVKSSAVETARQIGFALSAMLHGIGASAGLNKLDQTLQAVSGQDINSRFTISRLTDNTIYARVGAAAAPTGGMALIGQTYDISLLLLVPVGYFDDNGPKFEIQVVSHNEFRDANTGSMLPIRTSKAKAHAADLAMQDVLSGDKLAAWMAAGEDTKVEIAQRLSCPVQRSNYWEKSNCIKGGAANFEDLLAKTKLASAQKGAPDVSLADINGRLLWTRLSVLSADSPIKTAFFQLPDRQNVRIPAQTALLLDDTKDVTKVLLQNVTGVTNRTVNAVLELTDAARNREYALPAQTMNADSNTQVLTLDFPSLAKWGIANFDPNKSGLRLTAANCPNYSACPRYDLPALVLKLVYMPAPDPKAGTPSFDFTTKQMAIVVVDGKASVIVSINKLTDDDALISADNVDIASASDAQGNAMALVKGQAKVTKDMKNPTVTLQLQNVNVGMVVGLTAEGEKGGKSTGKKTIKLVAVAK
jgi:hypothetical protein